MPRRHFQKERGIYFLIHSFIKFNKTIICFLRKYQESLNIAEYPLHQIDMSGCIDIRIALSNPNIDVRFIEQDEVFKAYVNQARN